jgi:hypothetical protein
MGLASTVQRSAETWDAAACAKLLQRADAILRERFPGAETHLEPSPYNHAIGGYLVWDGFDGVDAKDRQRRMWEVFESEFTEEEMEHITAILTVTPLTYESILENNRS